MQSFPPPGRMRLFLMTFCLAGALALTGCASKPPPVLIPVPDALRERCVGPSTEAVETVGDLAVFSVRQEAVIAVCDARRAGAVALIDQRNAQVTPKPWWRFGR